jgi:site-specific recombinase XerD
MELNSFNLEDLDSLAASWLNRYRRIVAAKTTCRRLTSMRTLGEACGIQILQKYNAPTPLAGDPHPLPNGAQDVLKLLAACETDDQRKLVALTALCGCRVSEARETRPTDFNLAERKLKIWGKGAKERLIPLSDMAWDILFPFVVEAMLDGHPTLISMADRSARYCITMLGRRAGIERRIASHDMRATFATEAYYASGMDIRVVQTLLGHASVTQTQLYVKASDSRMNQAVNYMRGYVS